MYEDHRKLQKNRGGKFNIPKEEQFVRNLNTLFDIAHGDVLQMLDEDRKAFLFDQRSERRNYIAGFNSELNYPEFSGTI